MTKWQAKTSNDAVSIGEIAAELALTNRPADADENSDAESGSDGECEDEGEENNE